MKKLELRLVKSLFLMILGVSMMFMLFGCGKPKYKLHFEGYGFQSSKTEYAAGEQVTVYYDLIATDTDYRFWLDDENVKLKQDYDDSHGYVFTFIMPDHELTLHVSSHNSMEYIPTVSITFQNEVEEADVWLLPQTEENLKTSLWGTPSAGALEKGESAELTLTNPEYAEAWLIRIIDRDKAYYSAQDLQLEDGYTVVFKSEGSKFDAVIEVQDASGNLVFSAKAFTGTLGAKQNGSQEKPENNDSAALVRTPEPRPRMFFPNRAIPVSQIWHDAQKTLLFRQKQI